MNGFSIFKIFPKLEDANELTTLLEANEIQFSIVENTFGVDITFTGNEPGNIQIFLKQEDFNRVNQLIEAEVEEQLKDVDPNHYLFDFSKDELYEVLEKKEEWCTYDYVLAKHILTDKGELVDEKLLKVLRTDRISELAEPEKNSKEPIFFGYILAIIGSVLGFFINVWGLGLCIISFIIGMYLWKGIKSLPDGKKVTIHDQKSRAAGLRIAVFSAVLLVLVMVVNYYAFFS